MPVTSVTYVLVNNLGGITSMLETLVSYRPANALSQKAILLDIKENTAAPILRPFSNDIPVTHFAYSKKENWYSVFKSLALQVGEDDGVLVTNDVYDMLMLSYYNINKKVVQIVHDGYNVSLAVLYGDVADAFICHSLFFYEVMCQLLPHRRNDIYFINYGIPQRKEEREKYSTSGPLKLIFVGRHDTGKGIFDLIEIEKLLTQKGVKANWLILGKGPKTDEFKKQWEGKTNVTFCTPVHASEVAELLFQSDVFVFPTKFEGFPVSLLEAMSAGCVPIATDLPGGLRELVKDNVNGFLCSMDDNIQFAEKIEWLYCNREKMMEMGTSSQKIVKDNFDAAKQSSKYHNLFIEIASRQGKPAHHAVKRKLGSRLDQPWLPNALTKFLRRQ